MTPFCSVTTEQMSYNGQSLICEIKHYELLKDMVDRQDKGWVELDSIFDGGKYMIRIQDIVDLAYCPQSYITAKFTSDAINDA